MDEERIKNNQGLVVSIANKFKDFGEKDDLISEGNIGLLKAIPKFDKKRGVKFSTYASWYIYNEISRYVYKEMNLLEDIALENKKLNKVKRELEQELQREPLPEDLASELGVKVKKINQLTEANQSPVHLDEQVGETTVGAFIADETDLLEDIDEILLQDRIKEGLKTLTPRERTIIELTLQGYKSGEMDLGISEERVRQIKKEALKKLQASQ